MLLCLDIGNTHIYGGLFSAKEIIARFRFPSERTLTSDTFGLFLQDFFTKESIDKKKLAGVVISSVVQSIDYSISAACKKYLNLTPLELKPGVKTGIRLDIKNPLELGADRLANAIAAVDLFPNKNLIIADFGTATTVCAISKDKTYLGGTILPGFKLSMEALASKASLLSVVDICVPKTAVGKTTASNLQAGIYFGQLGAIKEIAARITREVFSAPENEKPLILATGGYAYLFQDENYFNYILKDLVLEGLRLVWEKQKR